MPGGITGIGGGGGSATLVNRLLTTGVGGFA
jgi:hypothetical protein